MIRRYFYTILFLIFSISGIASESFALSLSDIRMTMDKMFSYHVENKEFSPLLVKRSFRLYVEQFDPDRIYLLEDEVEPFLQLNTQMIREVMQEYQKDRFSHYGSLNHVIQKAIFRSQKVRKEQVEKLLRKGTESLNQSVSLSYSSYPKTEEELKSRVYNRLLLEVKRYLKNRPEAKLTPHLIQKILTHKEEKLQVFEKLYLDGSDHQLSLHTLKALAKSLDAHTGYYSPREAYDIRTSLKKQFSGVGVVLREDCDGVFIADLIEGGPAHKSGQMHVEDLLVAVDHLGVEDISFDELLDVMKGKEGTKLTLGVKRAAADSVVSYVELVREKITMNDERLTFSSELYGGGVIGKIDVPAFYDNGGKVSLDKDMREALKALKAEGELKGLVLDFRENSGGFLTQAIKVSSLFIDGGLIVISKYADGEVSYARDVDGRQYFDGPLVVLISKASASAAEIVAQALQDYGVALILGDERSYGKGSMQYQTLTDEKAQAFFKVTVGRYYTASGRSPQIQGVHADIVVPTIFSPYNIGERYLQFPLANDHLNGDVFHSLMNIKQGSYRDISRIVVPYLQPRPTKWRHMLPNLKANSQERLEQNKNFQFFLKVGNGYRPKKKNARSDQEFKQQNYGVEDLQIQEAVEIIKDMNMIQ